MQNIKLIISYDGRAYFGWQKTKTGPSIEESLQTALQTILQHPVLLQAASRTDAGVHALGQVINFFTSHPCLNLYRLLGSLNQLLPKDIRVLHVQSAPPHFHPTLDCSGKEYSYFICNTPVQLPLHRHDSWHFPHPIDSSLVHQAIETFIGTHDFQAFCPLKKGTHDTDFVRTIQSLTWQELEGHRIHVRITGTNFLYKMVRTIVGTLAYLGCGKLKLTNLSYIFESKERARAGITAPSHGLFLNQVFYKHSFN